MHAERSCHLRTLWTRTPRARHRQHISLNVQFTSLSCIVAPVGPCDLGNTLQKSMIEDVNANKDMQQQRRILHDQAQRLSPAAQSSQMKSCSFLHLVHALSCWHVTQYHVKCVFEQYPYCTCVRKALPGHGYGSPG